MTTIQTKMNSHVVSIIHLRGKNYPTWKVQCQMALMKESLWGIVQGTEANPGADHAERLAKFNYRWEKALAIIILAIDPSLLFLIGDPVSPVAMWKKLADQFQKKKWANKLHLRKRLYSLRIKEGGSVQEHIKTLTEIFNELSVVGDVITDEDRVVHLLASLPDSYNVLATALEASEEVPKMEIVTERLLHEERKSTSEICKPSESEKAMAAKRHFNKKKVAPQWGGGPRVVVSTAAFHARVRGSVPGFGGLKETKLFLPHPRVKVSIVGSLRDREIACSASDRQGSNFKSCVWRTVSSQSSHHPQEVLLAQFSLYVHKGGLKPDSFHFGPQCYGCKKFGHIKKDCHHSKEKINEKKMINPRHYKAHHTKGGANAYDSDSDCAGLIVHHVLCTLEVQSDQCIVDSGATCHMCNDKGLFDNFSDLICRLRMLLWVMVII